MGTNLMDSDAGRLQLLCSKSDIYIKGVRSVLRCSREDGKLSLATHQELAELEVVNVLGDVAGFLGKVELDEGPYLLLIAQTSSVGTIGPKNAVVYRIDKIVAVPVINDGSLSPVVLENDSGLDRLKAQQKKLFKFVSNKASSRLIDEVLKLVNDSASFYYSSSHDLTLRSQRFSKNPSKSADEFFWNLNLLTDLYDENKEILPRADEWILRVIHGYFEQKFLSYETESQLRLTLVSRRSTRRAGCRYLRRGVDDNGDVANFVESEMMINIFEHTLSFVQVRGSVPIYWSQKGYKYRPPLTIDKPLSESINPFRIHMDHLKEEYGGTVAMVNLVDHTGREFALGEAFLQHVLESDDPKLIYYSFDFHDHCRALRFDNVSFLLSALESALSEIGFCWIDKSGQMVREQTGVIRTNCVDCLDRTNVVQSAISQNVCAGQALKLGLIEPFTETPEILVQVLQTLWADHGDFISRQYAGTNALKGDITRGGQRKLVGLMKDGYNSASRYYLSHVKDAQRQRAMDVITAGSGKTFDTTEITMGVEAKTDEELEDEKSEEEDEAEVVENIGRMVHETARFILPENEVLVGGWALVDASNPSDQVDTVLLLTRKQIFIAFYAEDCEKLLELKTIDFEQISLLECGELEKNPRIHLRIYWNSTSPPQSGTWRAAKIRLFNNVPIALKDETEADEYIQAIAEQIRITLQMSDKPVELKKGGKLVGTNGKEKSGTNILTSLSSKLKLPSVKRAQQTKTADSLVPPTMTQSKSDGLLSSSALSSGIFGKLQGKLKTSFTRSTNQVYEQTDTPPGLDLIQTKKDQFDQYKEAILKSQSKIVML